MRYKYDSKRNRIEEAKYNSFGGMDWKIKRKINNLNQCMAETRYNAENKIKWQKRYEYDFEGSLVLMIEYQLKFGELVPVQGYSYGIKYF